MNRHSTSGGVDSTRNPRPGPSFYLSMLLIIVATMLVHESVHWCVGTLLGYDMYMTLTTAGLIDGSWRSDFDYGLVSIAGPIFTFSVGAVGAWLAIYKRLQFGYELVFAAFMQRFIAMLLSGVFSPNDEARVSLFLGLDWWVIPLVFVLPLLGLTIWSSRTLKFGFLVNLLCYLTASLAFTLMVYSDGKLAGFEGPSVLNPLLPEQVRYTD